MTNNKIQMPANFVALNENEMSCVEGGGIVSQICYAFGRMFRSTYYDNWESESKTLEQSHGLLFPRKMVSTPTLTVIPTRCLAAATGALPASAISSTASAICLLRSICKF